LHLDPADGTGERGPLLDLVAYRVLDERGDRIWLRHQTAEGWVDKNDVVRLDRAVEHFTKRIDANPKDADSHGYRAVARTVLNDLDLALADYDEAVRLSPQNFMWLTNRAACHIARKDFERALADLDEAVRINTHPVAFINRGVTHARRKRFEQAIADYNEALKLDPGFAAAYLNRAIARRLDGQLEAALSDLNEYTRLNPKAASGWHQRGLVKKAQGHLDDAIKDLSEALRLDAQIVTMWSARADIYLAKGDHESAFNDLDRAVGCDPQSPEGFLLRGNARAKLKQYDEALKDLDRALKTEKGPTHANLRASRGRLFAKMGRYADAAAEKEEAVRLAPKNESLLNGLAWLKATCPDEKVRNGKRAVELAAQACELTEWRNPSYLDTLAAAHAEVGNFDEAVKFQKKALDDPKFDKAETDKARERFKLYEARKAYREE
jgi:tetratricopeptide (TPR) repeat protein